MIKDRQPDWHDTNMALFGSDIEKKCKKAAADGEPQWDGAGVKAGLQVWRIEQFKVKPWPKSKFGKFHMGDSYIVLHTYHPEPATNPRKLAWDVHFWIGSESTQDEYGTAAYKTVELDDKLGGAALQCREVEGSESEAFKGFFGGKLAYLKGGAASGFKHVETNTPRDRAPTLFEVKGKSNNLRLREVHPLKRSSMNSGDVYILDCADGVFQYNGADSNPHERNKAAEFAAALASDRGGGVKVELVDDEKETSPFWVLLPGDKKVMGIKLAQIKVQDASKGGDDAKVEAFEPLLAKCTGLRGGKVQYKKVSQGEKPPRSKLDSGGVYLFDTGFELFLWTGKGAAADAKASAFSFAQSYLKQEKRPHALPVSRFNEGTEPQRFLGLFGPPEEAKGGGCCIIA